MKKLSKAVAMILAIAVIMSMSVSAFADYSYSNSASTVSSKDIEYYKDGRVKYWYEKTSNGWMKWVYVYDNYRNFLYRKCDLGQVETYTGTPIKSVNPQMLEVPLENVISFNVEYKVNNVFSGTGIGKRYVYICDCHDDWTYAGQFDYTFAGDYVKCNVSFDEPVDLYGVTIYREQIDQSSYNAVLYITGVVVAEYDYVF